MKSIISELWYGNFEPIDHFGKFNQEIKELENLMNKNLSNLESTINKSSLKILERYTECINEYIIVISEQAFCDGFSLGVSIFSEATQNAKHIVNN
ncbi:MAG: hypothetical protein E7531_01830 [Ruminococcaceae bacterium]|nr:hypothetical protein [Oscillospiraceae bacterium]